MAVAEWLFAFYLGAAHTQRAALAFSQRDPPSEISFTSTDFRGESFAPPLYYGYRVSYFPGGAPLGVEGEFTHLKVYANLPGGSVVQRFSMSHGLNLALVNLAARRTIRDSGQGPIRITARVGAGPTVPHVESAIQGVSREGYELGSIALHAGAGMEIALRGHISMLAEYKVTRTREHVEVAGGDARGLFVSHHAVVGVAWRTTR